MSTETVQQNAAPTNDTAPAGAGYYIPEGDREELINALQILRREASKIHGFIETEDVEAARIALLKIFEEIWCAEAYIGFYPERPRHGFPARQAERTVTK